MYKTAVRWMIRRNVAALNDRRHEPALAMFAPDAELSFPWDQQLKRTVPHARHWA